MAKPVQPTPRSPVLTQAEITTALATLPGWRHERDGLQKTYLFADFPSALAWIVRAGFEAEAIQHHPEWTNVYRTVHVRLTTHDVGGRVTSLDVELAARFEKINPPPLPLL